MQSAGKTSSIESKVQITNTEILATPTVNPPAHLMEDARRVRDETELHDSRKSTPQGKSIPGLSAGVLNKPLLSEPHLQPSDIPLYSRRSPRIAGLNAAAVTDAPIETQSSPIAIGNQCSSEHQRGNTDRTWTATGRTRKRVVLSDCGSYSDKRTACISTHRKLQIRECSLITTSERQKAKAIRLARLHRCRVLVKPPR